MPEPQFRSTDDRDCLVCERLKLTMRLLRSILFWSALGAVIAALSLPVFNAHASGILSLPATVVQTNQANTYTAGLQNFSGVPWKPAASMVGSLPAASAGNLNEVYLITDGTSATDCTTGGGSTRVWCQSNASAWAAVGGASAGSGTVNSGSTGQTAAYASAGTVVSGSSNLSIRSFGAGFDGGGSALTTGKTTYYTIPFACTIAAYSITVDTGTVSLDVWKVATGTAIPTVSNSILTGGFLALSTGTALHSTSTALFTTTTVSANDIVGINLEAVASATQVSLVIQCNGSV